MTDIQTPPDDLEGELEYFRQDEEAAQQAFFAWLGIRNLAGKQPEILNTINRNSMFWITTNHALTVDTFIGLGRLFDQNSAHNLNLLLRMVERNLPMLNRTALRTRKELVVTPEQAAEYVKEKHDLTVDDVRAIKKEVKGWRKIYEPVYGEVRDHLAHNKRGVSDIGQFLAKTDIEEMKRMFGFLHALHEGLRELHLNGRNPLPLPTITFVLPPDPKPSRQYHPGEKAYREAQAVLKSMM